MKKVLLVVLVVISLLMFESCLRPAEGNIDDMNAEQGDNIQSVQLDDSILFNSDAENDNNTIDEDHNEELNLMESDSADDYHDSEDNAVEESTPFEEVELEESENVEVEILIGIPDENGVIPVSKIELDRYTIEIYEGQVDMPWATVLPQNATYKNTTWISDNPSVASVDSYGRITAISEGQCMVSVVSGDNADVKATVNVTVHKKAAITEPTYINGIMIANKSYPLPENYNPGIDSAAYSAVNAMIQGAASDGISLYVISGFRSYQTQQTLYSNYLLREGRDAADKYSARPGYSEHQTGLAFDMNSLFYSFADTAEGKWLAEHCHEYGFIIRYPQDKEECTGYTYEPWHIRYLGVDIAKDVVESGLCLEEYLGITSQYDF